MLICVHRATRGSGRLIKTQVIFLLFGSYAPFYTKLLIITCLYNLGTFYSELMKYFFCILIIFLNYCQKTSFGYFGTGKWMGYDEQNQKIHLSSLEKNGLVINFYSPICLPCIEELPALHLLYEEAQRQKVAFYLGISQKMNLGILKTKGSLREILKEDVQNYNIKIPLLFMDKSFEISPSQIVQATPETLFFYVDPLTLVYNMVGSISHRKKKEEIKKDPRFQFALKKIQRLAPEL